MNENELGNGRRRAQHLVRLQRLTDVVYGVIILQLFLTIPTPDSVGMRWDSLGAYLSEHGFTIAVVLIGIAFVAIYWLQSIQLLGTLRATDSIHTTLSIFQLFFLMVFLYSLQLGVHIGGSAGTWAFESISATMVGLISLFAFARARKKGLLHPDVSTEEARRMAIRYRAEPLTTSITIPFAFMAGPVIFGFSVAWEFSWFIYPIVVAIVNRIAKQKAHKR
ncbi:TMEM175 family protein [Acidobacteriota bacterium]